MTDRLAQYNERFQRELTRLNPAQRRAVETIEGPVLVVAGPGTGKTHILAARIGQILLATDAQAHNLLCLTFTDAGVRAMRRRLLDLIGPEAHRVHIFTFHSFCNALIQDNLAIFGHRDLEPITELEEVALVRQLLDELPGDHPLRRGRGHPYFYERHLRHLFATMKNESWSDETVAKAIDAYVADLPTRPDYQYKRKYGPYRKGDLKEAQYQLEVGRMELLRAGAALFPAYQRAMLRLRRYDYADMIRWVNEAFETHPLLLRSYQEQYLYLLVDEYQDTNGAQNRILRQLAGFWEAPNLFIVGDDDQSIYEFQGARLRNIIDYYQTYREQLAVVVLADNYRSSQPILDAAGKLIDHNEQRLTVQLAELGLKKVLAAQHPTVKDLPMQPQVRVYPNQLQEEADLVAQLRARHAAGTPWREMAVIYARHRQVEGLQRRLDQQGIPYETRRPVNVLDLPLIRQWRTLLQYLRQEQERPFSGDHLLFKLLHFRCFGLAPLDLARLSLSRTDLPFEEQPQWRIWLRESERWPAGLQEAEGIRRVARWLESLQGRLQELSLPALVETVLAESGLLDRAARAPDRVWQLQVCRTFTDFVQAEVSRRPRLTLAELLDNLEQMDDNRLRLDLRKDMELREGVQLVTAHSAKGLEFDEVFLLDAAEAYWEAGRRRGNTQFAFPDALTLSGETDATEAQRRLFYVALTRARRGVYISYGLENREGKAQQPCRFVDELLLAGAAEEVRRELAPEVLADAELPLLQPATATHLPALERSLLSERLDGYVLSISALNRYLDCPLRFLYEQLLRAPQYERPAAVYGTAMHAALQRFFDTMLADPDRRYPSTEDLLRFFDREMHLRRARFADTEFDRRLAQGRRHLRLYDQRHRQAWPRQLKTEMAIQLVEVEGVPLRGVIDRVDFGADMEVKIVDYKTGSHRGEKVKTPSDTQPEGGSYWRQLVFYKLLFENRAGAGQRVRTGTISYLDVDTGGQLNDFEYRYRPEDTGNLRRLLRETYQAIQAQEFYTGCGKPTCEWCRFVRDDAYPPVHTSEEIEGLR